MVAPVKTCTRLFPLVCAALLLTPAARSAEVDPTAPLTWPTITQTAKPWAYWWWMASAVDTNNLAKELARYRDAGMGGVHVIPIYGAKGWESNAIPYLSPKWFEMLAFTVQEAKRLGLGVDMTTGSGWCFGGPKVTDADANASVVWKTYQLGAGERITERLDRQSIQAVVATAPAANRLISPVRSPPTAKFPSRLPAILPLFPTARKARPRTGRSTSSPKSPPARR